MLGQLPATFGVYALDPYGSLNLTDASPRQSFTEPLTLAEVKTYLKVPLLRSPVDSYEDDEINALIAAARTEAENLQGRDLVRKQWDYSLDYWMNTEGSASSSIKLRAPLISVDLVQVKDSKGALTVLQEDVNYVVDKSKQPGLIVPPYNQTWFNFTPWPSSAILVRYTSGMANDAVWWDGNGAVVKTGMRRLIADWYFRRLPFDPARPGAIELPFGVTAALGQGAVRFVR